MISFTSLVDCTVLKVVIFGRRIGSDEVKEEEVTEVVNDVVVDIVNEVELFTKVENVVTDDVVFMIVDDEIES